MTNSTNRSDLGVTVNLLTLFQLLGGVAAVLNRNHHLPQQGHGASHLLLTHPVLHQTQVGVVGGQEPQQGRVQTCTDDTNVLVLGF